MFPSADFIVKNIPFVYLCMVVHRGHCCPLLFVSLKLRLIRFSGDYGTYVHAQV